MSYGLIELEGKQYLEKFHAIPYSVTLSAGATVVLLNQRVVMQGDADFLLKDVRARTADALGLASFDVRLGNSDGTYYSQTGVGLTNDRVIGTLFCGDAQFPGLVIPYARFSKTGAITLDLGNLSASENTIKWAFVGSLIFPVNG